MPELSKNYAPNEVEERWYQRWLDDKAFVADPARVSEKRPAYSIVIPPPNVTGILTLGHVLNNTIQDILCRRARMLGKEVLWLPGTDHAGIATQNVVEKALKKQGAIKHRDDLGREKLVEKIWEWKEKHGGIIIQQLKKLGASCDWSRERFTMDEDYSRCVQKVFVDLYKKGLIYRGKRMVNWCPSSLTALSDEEVTMKQQNGFLYYFKVEVVEEPGTWLTIATTRPETIPGDTAIAVNPKDERYAHLIGKHIRRPLPLEDQASLPIIGDEHVDFEFGTGVLKVTPAHDKADFEILGRIQHWAGTFLPFTTWHKELLSMDPIDILHPNGVLNHLSGIDLAGLDRFEARKKAVALLTEMGALVKEEPYQNNVGYSERADVPVEPRLSEQWFLKYPSVEKARGCVAQMSDKILQKDATIIRISGDEFGSHDRGIMRKAALELAQTSGWIGKSFHNDDTSWQIEVRRKSLSHTFNNRNALVIQALAVLPDLIRSAVLVSTEPHLPPHPQFLKVHRFIACLSVDDALHALPITVKETADGHFIYDYKAKKMPHGGKPLGAHSREGKLGLQPAPSGTVKVSDLMADVNAETKMRFFPDRWAKVYDHWMGGLQDWCISRQLWWGHRVPVWSKEVELNTNTDLSSLGAATHSMVLNSVFSETNATMAFSISGIGGHETHARRLRADGGRFKLVAATTSDEDAKLLVAEGFTQDPDVLDTWFSSWLWPFATMGWPNETADLKAFYPTTDLVTGPDIIFFWVARMIMAGYEWMGEMPFKNVYFTGIIRDKQGRKMSKSLGNSPDPLDLIEKFGADALRFGIMRSAPLGSDIMFDEKNVELGRNFCTKLWNAARFRQMQVGTTETEINSALLSSDDKWILLRLNVAIHEVTTALEEYRFSDATATLYRFFWSEYCDWYVEASKATLQGTDEKRKANTLAVIDFVLGQTLRLFHPFLPFITEELWHGMGFANDMPVEQGGRSIMFAPWPKPLDADELAHFGLLPEDEEFVSKKHESVNLGRGMKTSSNIASNKRVRFVLKPIAPLAAHEIEVLKILLNADPFEVDPNYDAPKGTPTTITPLGDLFLPLEGLVDVAAEHERLQKEIAKVESELGKVRTKLADENFAAKVPAKVLDDHKQRETDWSSKLTQLQKMLEALG